MCTNYLSLARYESRERALLRGKACFRRLFAPQSSSVVVAPRAFSEQAVFRATPLRGVLSRHATCRRQQSTEWSAARARGKSPSSQSSRAAPRRAALSRAESNEAEPSRITVRHINGMLHASPRVTMYLTSCHAHLASRLRYIARSFLFFYPCSCLWTFARLTLISRHYTVTLDSYENS